MIYTLMHKKIPIADIEIDTDDGEVLKIYDVHNIEHIPIGVTLKMERSIEVI